MKIKQKNQEKGERISQRAPHTNHTKRIKLTDLQI